MALQGLEPVGRLGVTSFTGPIFKRNNRRQGLDRTTVVGSRLTIRRTGSR
jgi:hypothetical protein